VSGRRRTMSFEPETTIGRVKELVWNTWLGGESPIGLRPFRFLFYRIITDICHNRLARRTATSTVILPNSLSRESPSR
jgi:hypothetical protein